MLRFVTLGLALVACNDHDHDHDHDHGHNEEMLVGDGGTHTDEGTYHLMLSSSPDPLVSGEVSLEIKVMETANNHEAVTGATIEITPWMPDMDHGIGEAPEVVELETEGSYEATWEYSMPGRWELTIDITADPGTDSVVVAHDVE